MNYRPCFWTALFFISGIITGYYTFELPLIFLVIIISAMTVILFFLFSFNGYRTVIFLLIIFILGFSWINYQESKYYGEYSTAFWNDTGIREVRGEIKLDLKNLEGEYIYIKPLMIDGNKILNGLIQIEKKFISRKVKNGDLVKLQTELKTPSRQLNPGGFSRYKYLKKQGIYSYGLVKSDINITGSKDYKLKNNLIQFKTKLIELINNSIKNPENRVIKAILLGERENLPKIWNRLFTRAGANHLLAISGLHVGFITLIFVYIFRIIPVNTFLTNIIISIFLLIYIIITGGSASVLRASILSILFLWAPFFKKEGDLFNILGICILINLIINPYSLFTVSLQLSYGVLIVIVLWTEIFAYYTWKVIAVSLAAQLGSIPVAAYYFNQITPVGIITNIWAIPLTGVLVLINIIGLGLGLFLPVIYQIAGRLTEYILLLMKYGTSLMGKIPYGNLEIFSPGLETIVIICFLLIILPFILKKKILYINKIKQKKRLIGILVIIIIIITANFIYYYFYRELEMIFFAVGQGDGIFLSLPDGSRVLIDGGGAAGLDSSQGERVILPYFKKKGIKKLDLVFVTHLDSDHALGIIDIVKSRKIDLLILPSGYKENNIGKEILSEAKNKNIRIKEVKLGDVFDFSDLTLEIFNPITPDIINRNENSIVIKLNYHEFTALLTGDMGKIGENRVMNLNLDIECNILKVGHHGSNTSSSSRFLKKVNPLDAVISVGERNFYGHPSPDVLTALENNNINIWRTDKKGAIMIRSDGFNYTINGFLGD
ncbi:MAG: DNA internalization-related competence protein ComEC/Rec2 [Bacillota bacterium]